MNSNEVILAQGYKYIVSTLIVAIILSLLDFNILGTILFILTAFIAFTYRNPHRQVFANSNNVLSPIDGTVTAIDLKNGKQIIYCKVTPCDTAVVRAPIDSSLKIESYQNGLNLNPNSYKANLLNEQITFIFDNIKLKLISGLCNPKIKHTDSKNIKQGDSIALFIDGLAIITIQENQNLLVKIGDKLKSAQTIIYSK
ncbi:MAG: hypothetical protein U9R16_00130 [Campylobacterota bacterium]|nr:hypothetical protein [Campylobacterota bacterium]